VPSSLNATSRDRKSDFFLFSKEFSGSPATGYFPTKGWQTNSAQPDLATATAISGAASSYMKLGSLPTAILTFLNVRFGFWIKQPRKPNNSYPRFLYPMREMFGFLMSPTAGTLRTSRSTSCCAGAASSSSASTANPDPTYSFQSLMTLVRHAQIDFGVRIEVNLSDNRPDPKTG